MNLELGYLLLTIIVLIVAIAIGDKAIRETIKDKGQALKARLLLIGGLVLWHIYVYWVSHSGLLADLESLPPKPVIFLILPLFSFTAIFLYLNRNKAWIMAVPIRWLVMLQAFRVVVEVLLALSADQGILPQVVTIRGYNFDMIYAFTAPVIYYLVFTSKKWSLKAVRLWNYLGIFVLATVISVFMSTMITPEIHGSTQSIMPVEFTHYPYTLVAGFLMPFAIFTHVLSLVQLRRTI